MKKMNFLIALVVLFSLTTVVAQEEKVEKKDKLSYYEDRGAQDASYEQSLEVEKEEEADFWKGQEQYEKDLKKRDRKAYRAYMKGKSDAYAEHAAHCDSHCHHSDYYHHHTTYYYSYQRNYYPRRRSTINTGVRVSAPSVRVGIL